ncbi:MAG TPA: amidase family protein [Acidimicrobiales bacterium]|nr:amidase family protein [Acidimicrobiales bacterium]
MDFRTETVAELAGAVRGGERSAVELVTAALDRIESLDGRVGAFVALDPEGAMTRARALDQARANGEVLGPLAGVPIGVKDLEDAAGLPTTRGSAAFAGRGPAKADSILVARLKAAGAVVVGKTNTPELGWKAETDNVVFGATRNPFDLDRSPGGSSGGSAAAVAAGMVPLATGSDGGGSIRIPSAVCGLSGMKPSLGRVPSGGPEAPGWGSLSTKGVLGRRIADVVDALAAVIGPDPSDLASLPMPDASWLGALRQPHLPARVAWSPTLGYAPVDQEVREICERALRELEAGGVEVEQVDTVFPEDPIVSWLALTNAFNLRSVEPWRGTEIWDRLDPGMVAQAEWAAGMSAAELVRAEDRCHELNLALVEVFHRVRLLVCPTTAAPAPLSGEPGVINGGSDLNWVRFTYPFNLTRSPAATVCAGTTATGLPVGLQLVGPQHGDQVVIRAAAAAEAALGPGPLAPVG